MLWMLSTWAFAAELPADLEAAKQKMEESTSQWMLQDVPQIPDSAWNDVLKGKVATGLEAVEGYAVKKAWGVGIVNAPIDSFWGAVNDEMGMLEATDLDHTERIAGGPCEVDRRVLQVLPVSMASDRWWISIRKPNSPLANSFQGGVRELTWTSSVDSGEVTTEAGLARLEKAIPIEFSKGSWLLIKLDDQRTLVRYNVWTDPGGSLPGGMLNWFATGSIKRNFANMTELAANTSMRCGL